MRPRSVGRAALLAPLVGCALVASACTGSGNTATELPGPEERPGVDPSVGLPDSVPEAEQIVDPTELGYEWEVLSSGAGGFVTGLDSNADGSVRIARTDVGGLYRWNDDGEQWVQMLSLEGVDAPELIDWQVESVAIAPSNPDRIYLSAGDTVQEPTGTVLISDDGGATWARSPQRFTIHGNGDWRTSGERLAVDPADPDVVLLGTRTSGLWRSTDGGISFEAVADVPIGSLPTGVSANSTPAGVLFVVFGADGSSVVAGVSGEGVYRSLDRGVSWDRIIETEGMPFDAEEGVDGRMWIVQRDPGGVWSVDGDDIVEVTPADKRFEAVSVDPFDPDRVLAGGVGLDGNLWLTVDGGNEWRRIEIEPTCPAIPWLETYPLSFFPSGSIRFDRTAPDHVWVPEGFAVWWGPLDEGVLRLECRSAGIEELVSNDVIVPPGGRPITAHWDRAVFWHGSTSSADAVAHPATRFNSGWDLDWSPADPSFAVAVIGDQRTCCRNEDDAFLSAYSTDGGRTWTPFDSYDNGTHPANLVYGNIAVSADDIDNIVWLPSFNGPVHVSRDRGTTWSPVILPGTEDLTNDNGVYTGGSHFQFFLNRKVLVADRVEPATFYLYHRFGLYRSVDGGTTWELAPSENLPTGGLGQFGSQLVASPLEAGHLLYTPGPQSSGVPVPVYESVDGGDTWRLLPGLSDATAMGFGAPLVDGGPATVFLAGSLDGERGVWRSIDGLASWELITRAPLGNYQSIKTLTGSLDEPGTLYVGFTGTSFMVGRLAPMEEG